VRGQSLQNWQGGSENAHPNREESPVVLEDGRFAHPLEASHQHIDQRQKQIRRLEMAGGLWRQHIPLQQPAQTQLLTKRCNGTNPLK
jgi:hypothetical protein